MSANNPHSILYSIPVYCFALLLRSASHFTYFAYNKMPGRLEGKIALISGSSQGFGRGILETFVREGAFVLGLDLKAVDGPVNGFPEDRAYQISANVAEEESWKRAVRFEMIP